MLERDAPCCLVCGRECRLPERVSAAYAGERCQFCSRKCQAMLEQYPERYLPQATDLLRPLGYS